MVLWQIKPAIALSLFCALFFLTGCGSAWNGRIIYLEGNRVLIKPEVGKKVENGHRLLIYREESITHPATGEVLGTIRDNIAEIPVLWVRDRTITALATERESETMSAGDRVTVVRGLARPRTGYIQDVGRINEVNANEMIVMINAKEQIRTGEGLTVIRYVKAIDDPDTKDILAVETEPIALLRIVDANTDGQSLALYDLIDKKMGWIEIGDIVVRRTGDMLNETLWFQNPPDGFSRTWIADRSYQHSIRYYDSGQYREAILELNDAIQADPEYKAEYLLGICNMNLNRYDEAVSQFNDYLKKNPDDAKTWTALAYTYLKQDKLQEAVESYEKLVKLLPGDPKVWVDMGDIYGRLGDRQKAEQAYEKALEINQNDEEAIYELQIEQPVQKN